MFLARIYGLMSSCVISPAAGSSPCRPRSPLRLLRMLQIEQDFGADPTYRISSILGPRAAHSHCFEPPPEQDKRYDLAPSYRSIDDE